MAKQELVAPAGSLAKLKYAIEYGADAVYCGIPDFSLRVRINQFSREDALEGIKYAHSKNKKAYVTTNIFAHNNQVNKLPEYLALFKEEMPDAFIASDPGIIATIKKELPEAEIHLSTQANCTNWQAAKFWHDLGVKRVVLGREVTLEEIKEIKEKVPELELEVFVHGAMCMSYSGRCFLSAWMSGRSANDGDCAQSCRWKYSLVEELRPNEYIPVEQDQHGTYLLNSKDLCLIDYLKDLVDAGVDAFKIEGRAKSTHYLATTVLAYRQVIDSDFSEESIKKGKEELEKNVNRKYTTGFLLGTEEKERNNFKERSIDSGWEFVGTVEEARDDGVVIKVHNALLLGDDVEILQPYSTGLGQANGKLTRIKIKKLINVKNDEEVGSAHGGIDELFLLPITQKFPLMSILRKKIK